MWTCLVQTSGRAGTNLGRVAGRDLLPLALQVVHNLALVSAQVRAALAASPPFLLALSALLASHGPSSSFLYYSQA